MKKISGARGIKIVADDTIEEPTQSEEEISEMSDSSDEEEDESPQKVKKSVVKNIKKVAQIAPRKSARASKQQKKYEFSSDSSDFSAESDGDWDSAIFIFGIVFSLTFTYHGTYMSIRSGSRGDFRHVSKLVTCRIFELLV